MWCSKAVQDDSIRFEYKSTMTTEAKATGRYFSGGTVCYVVQGGSNF